MTGLSYLLDLVDLPCGEGVYQSGLDIRHHDSTMFDTWLSHCFCQLRSVGVPRRSNCHRQSMLIIRGMARAKHGNND